jgi:hypothetical protein
MAREKSTRGVVIEFLGIICLKTKNGALKLSRNVGIKFDKVGKNIRFVTQRECPCKMRIIV